MPGPEMLAPEPPKNLVFRIVDTCAILERQSPVIPYDKIGPVVTIIVGNGHSFATHAGLLTEHSTYFSGLFRNMEYFEEGSKGVHLRDEDPDVFKIFIDWLHNRHAPLAAIVKGLPTLVLLQLFVFADARGVELLRFQTLDLFTTKFATEGMIPLSFAPYVYENTPENSILRKMLVDMVVLSKKDLRHLCPSDHACVSEAPDFLIDITAALQNVVGGNGFQYEWSSLNISRCKWHDHKLEHTHEDEIDSRFRKIHSTLRGLSAKSAVTGLTWQY